WEAPICGPKNTPEGGRVFVAKCTFARPLAMNNHSGCFQLTDYPLSPFEMGFDPPFHHPNIYPDAKVCISISHTPGDDPTMCRTGGNNLCRVSKRSD
ncbi:hypothetical protein BKA83DRAFT_4056966, partial [Pisolithus microcarpus]